MSGRRAGGFSLADIRAGYPGRLAGLVSVRTLQYPADDLFVLALVTSLYGDRYLTGALPALSAERLFTGLLVH